VELVIDTLTLRFSAKTFCNSANPTGAFTIVGVDAGFTSSKVNLTMMFTSPHPN
jgi:phage portal protein BeeE